MREFRRFLAAMALVLAAVGVLAAWLHQSDPDEILIDAGVSAAPAAWPVNAGLSTLAGAPVIKPPPDRVSRAKFPGEDPREVDGLAFLNQTVNHLILPLPDAGHYADDQQMVSWPADLKGDCEDYALSKLVSLIRAKVLVIEVSRLRFVYAPVAPGELDGHIILEVRLSKGAIAFLDNNFDPLMTRRELEARGYKFFDW